MIESQMQQHYLLTQDWGHVRDRFFVPLCTWLQPERVFSTSIWPLLNTYWCISWLLTIEHSDASSAAAAARQHLTVCTTCLIMLGPFIFICCYPVSSPGAGSRIQQQHGCGIQNNNTSIIIIIIIMILVMILTVIWCFPAHAELGTCRKAVNTKASTP